MNSILSRKIVVPSIAQSVLAIVKGWGTSTPFGGTVYKYENSYRPVGGYSYKVNCPELGEFTIHDVHAVGAWTDGPVDYHRIIHHK
jgi:hypothetical protein